MSCVWAPHVAPGHIRGTLEESSRKGLKCQSTRPLGNASGIRSQSGGGGGHTQLTMPGHALQDRIATRHILRSGRSPIFGNGSGDVKGLISHSRHRVHTRLQRRGHMKGPGETESVASKREWHARDTLEREVQCRESSGMQASSQDALGSMKGPLSAVIASSLSLLLAFAPLAAPLPASARYIKPNDPLNPLLSMLLYGRDGSSEAAAVALDGIAEGAPDLDGSEELTGMVVMEEFEGEEEEVGEGDEYVRPPPQPAISIREARLLGGIRESDKNTEAQQVHVSLWGPGRMLVTWITNDESAPSTVEFGLQPGKYTGKATGTAQSYSYLAYESALIHQAVLGSPEEPLRPGTLYYYRCSEGSRELSFKTPPAEGPLRVVVVGDMGQTPFTVSTLENIQAEPHDLLILPGDLSYADRYQPRWDSWGNLVEPLASRTPWMVVAGNHEKEGIPFIEPNFKAYEARWPQPHELSGSPSPQFYSFETAGVHWLMLGSYSEFFPGSEQYEWLTKDLGSVDRRRTPWLIAVLHAPWYNSNFAHQGEAEGMRRSMERVLYEAGTDVVFSGHVHAYERTAPVFDNKLDPCGMVHIVIGDGGNREGLEGRYFEPPPDWSIRREASFGHGQLQFNTDGSADWSWHRNDDARDVTADDVRFFPHVEVEADEAGGVAEGGPRKLCPGTAG